MTMKSTWGCGIINERYQHAIRSHVLSLYVLKDLHHTIQEYMSRIDIQLEKIFLKWCDSFHRYSDIEEEDEWIREWSDM